MNPDRTSPVAAVIGLRIPRFLRVKLSAASVKTYMRQLKQRAIDRIPGSATDRPLS